MQNIDIVQLNYIATLNGELTVCMPPCLTYTKNRAFNYNGQTYNTTTYPILQVQRNLYSNTNETVKYFHCFNFIYFLSMIESQMQTVNNGILFNYNMNDNTISISVLKSYIDAGNTIAFNKSFLKVLPFIVKYFDGVMDHICFNKKLIITLNTDDYYTAIVFKHTF